MNQRDENILLAALRHLSAANIDRMTAVKPARINREPLSYWKSTPEPRSIFERLPKWLQRRLARAAPTCTLWRPEWNRDALIFRPWPALYITGMDMVMLR